RSTGDFHGCNEQRYDQADSVRKRLRVHRGRLRPGVLLPSVGLRELPVDARRTARHVREGSGPEGPPRGARPAGVTGNTPTGVFFETTTARSFQGRAVFLFSGHPANTDRTAPGGAGPDATPAGKPRSA